VVPTICFGYQCHVSVIPIYSCFKTRNLKQFSVSMSLAITICVSTYTIAATYGYLTFGSKIGSDILKSYNAKDPYVFLAIIAISIKTYTTYPILSFCGNAAVNDLWANRRGVAGVDPRNQEKFRMARVTVWFFASLFLAIVMPNIGSVIQLLGSFSAVFIFIFPGMCVNSL
jgi:sodium-coupled neutral amino acid transporter 7/8